MFSRERLSNVVSFEFAVLALELQVSHMLHIWRKIIIQKYLSRGIFFSDFIGTENSLTDEGIPC